VGDAVGEHVQVLATAVAPLLTIDTSRTSQEEAVDIKVGIQHVSREVVVDSSETAKDIEKAFSAALSDDTVLRLTDAHGRQVLIPANKIAYIDLGEENARRVGFGTL
jgi:hypothetical protein